MPTETEQATQYLEKLIGQVLRIHTNDSRIFVGFFKCTDAVSLCDRRWPQTASSPDPAQNQ